MHLGEHYPGLTSFRGSWAPILSAARFEQFHKNGGLNCLNETFEKGKVGKSSICMFPQKSSGKRVSQGEKVERKRWQIGSLVTCVPRTFQVIAILTNTGKSTVETISSNVHSATNHSAKLLI